MSKQPNIDMTYQEFGHILIKSEDLDPVYVMLVDAQLPILILKKFLLAYWCFYHCGVAAYIAESKNFYLSMWKCATSKSPRGMERRFFWGSNAFKAINHLESSGEPEDIVDDMCHGNTFQHVYNSVCKYVGFGPWMGWKIADMAERVLGYDVDFSDSELGIYKDPIKGAALIMFGDKNHAITVEQLHTVCNDMEHEFSSYMAPPCDDRPINIQEVETILCKYKAHCYGFYPLGRDTLDITEGLHGWGNLSQELQKHMPVWTKE